MKFSVVIAGAGPAGLACAKLLAEAGRSVLVLERKSKVGPKVCAGGITWSGLINTVPTSIEEKRFPVQHVITRLQRAKISEDEPIIATVNREQLGAHMASLADTAGAVIQTNCYLTHISDNSIRYRNTVNGEEQTVHFDYLVGADGSSSTVRRHLNLPTEHMGVGINYQIPVNLERMEWHLNRSCFSTGYGWIFPHKETASIGAYADRSVISAKDLKKGLISWAFEQGYNLSDHKAHAEFINFDYRGWNFGNIFLAGDAAGFASALTGEGIYPAIVSGEHVAHYILQSTCSDENFARLLRMQKIHKSIVKFNGAIGPFSELFAEAVVIALRSGLLKFDKIEMAR